MYRYLISGPHQSVAELKANRAYASAMMWIFLVAALGALAVAIMQLLRAEQPLAFFGVAFLCFMTLVAYGLRAAAGTLIRARVETLEGGGRTRSDARP